VAHPLGDARAKLEQARHHLRALKAGADAIAGDPDRHCILADYDTDEDRYVVYSKMSEDPLPNLSLGLGDLIHCARGALDFTAWQLAIKHLGREPTEDEGRQIQFPITESPDRFERSRARPYFADDVAQEVLRFQPHSPEHIRGQQLGTLQWVSNRDKHRLVVPLVALINPPLLPEYNFESKLPRGTEVRSTFLIGPRRGAGEDEVYYCGDPTTFRLGWVELTPRPPNTRVELSMPAPLEVRFLGPGNALISVDDVERIVETVEEVVRRFEQFAPDAE
jgi:hypothetical protein